MPGLKAGLGRKGSAAITNNMKEISGSFQLQARCEYVAETYENKSGHRWRLYSCNRIMPSVSDIPYGDHRYIRLSVNRRAEQIDEIETGAAGTRSDSLALEAQHSSFFEIETPFNIFGILGSPNLKLNSICLSKLQVDIDIPRGTKLVKVYGDSFKPVVYLIE